MKKQPFRYSLLTLLLALALLLVALPALAAEEEAAPATQPVSIGEIWDDLSYTKFLLHYAAFFELNDAVTEAATMEDLLDALYELDPWMQYYPADSFELAISNIVGDFVGIGVYLRTDPDRVVIAGVIANSPAEKAGIKSGDIVVEVDGVNTRNASAAELQALLRGEENTILTLKYERNGKVTELIMNRKRIIEPSMEYWMLTDNIGYVSISTFTTHTGEELAAGIKSLKKQGMTALLVDLRDCPGGELDGAVETSGVLAGEGPMLFIADKQGYQTFAPVDEVEELDMPLAVLINGNTASSAELVSANVQDANAGVLVGVPTYGKGVVQTVINLPSGAGISFTTDKYISRGYQDVDAQGGLLPDIYVADKEAQQDAAVSWLNKQLQQPALLAYFATLKGYSKDGDWQKSTVSLYLEDDTAYVPLNITLKQFGWQIEESEGILYATYNEHRIIVDTANNNIITKAGEYNLLKQNSELYMPAKLLRQYGYTVTWVQGELSVRIEK